MQQIANYGHDTAENILWHSQDNALYWLDIPAGKIFRGHFQHTKAENLTGFESCCILQMEEPIGGFVFCQPQLKANGQADAKVHFLLFAAEGRIYQWAYRGKQGADCRGTCPPPKLYCQVQPNLVPNRFNDVFALPSKNGRFVLCGTMPSDGQADSRLLLFNAKQKSIEVVQQHLKLANGMGIHRGWLYFADTRDFAVYCFPITNIETANIDWSLRQKLIDFHGRPGRPDGLCLDNEGRLWLAETGAGMITCFGANGGELGRLTVGTPKVTSCCFGGSQRQILFVSTQGGQGATGKAGGIFAQSTAPPFAPFCGQDEALI